MNDHGYNEDIWHPPAWGRAFALLAGVAFIVALYYYKTHPQVLQTQVGALVAQFFGIATGSYLVFEAIIGIRSGAVSGNYTPGKFSRSENASMFWFVVVCDFIFGGFLLAVDFGLLFGLLSA